MTGKVKNTIEAHEIFKKEWKIVHRSQDILNKEDISIDKLKDEYRSISKNYKKLLKEMIKITRIGDVNYKKLMDANDRIQEQKSELEVLNQELRDTNAVKDKFYSIIAHDLKDPLQVLLISSEILQNDLENMLEEEIGKYVGSIYRTSGNLSALLQNLLQWSRSQYGEMECRPGKIDLHFLAEEHIEYYIENAQNKNIHLISNIPRNSIVYADENMIRSVVRNLVGNAVKFTEPGGKVTLTSKEKEDIIVTSVIDTGVGIPEDKLDLLFKLGENYTTVGTAKERGTGLGLMLFKEFVEKNGGAISVTSKPGEGSVFTFSLPKPNPDS
jgi:signal transduction histidine kinase